ncbi:MAG: aldo/keto reductase [Atopostipes suicloacalis]|nr:aldo/keto reductase [Atopostipes suicloacalis]MDN6731511.1 aldo/keto reductase [Atopostipes suicloacalis]
MSLKDTYKLNDGNEIPVVGFGTWQMPNNEDTTEIVEHAIEVGYRHIDTAAIYKNEEAVGRGIKRAIDRGLVTRDELFVTTKLWNDDQTYDLASQALDDSLERLALDYVDLYLIHWPNPKKYRDHWQEANAESWRAMEEGRAAGKVRSLGISNFMPRHLKPLIESAKVKPAVNQIFLNPSDAQEEAVAENKKHNILSEAYSPLATGKIFEIDELDAVAKKYDKTVAQIVLRWSLQNGFLPLPKTETMSRVAENADLFDFELSKEDMETIDSVKGMAGEAQDPDTTSA